MRHIYQKQIVEELLERYQVRAFFDTLDISFHLACYEVGEVLVSPLSENRDFQLVVEGDIRLYAIREDGSRYLLTLKKGIHLLGDLEFVTGTNQSDFWVEAQNQVTAVCFSREQNREKLQNDVRFLNFMLQMMAEKMKLASVNEASFASLEEKLQNYLLYQCEDKCLSHVGKAAEYLHCSRRQLQRILRKLCEEGTLVKEGKGRYHISGVRGGVRGDGSNNI